MVREIVGHEGTGTVGKFFVVTVDTPVVFPDRNTSVVHLNLEVAVILVEPVNPGVLANTPLAKGVIVRCNATHVGSAILALDTLIRHGHVSPVSGRVRLTEASFNQVTSLATR